jgi:hypothetical protein
MPHPNILLATGPATLSMNALRIARSSRSKGTNAVDGPPPLLLAAGTSARPVLIVEDTGASREPG